MSPRSPIVATAPRPDGVHTAAVSKVEDMPGCWTVGAQISNPPLEVVAENQLHEDTFASPAISQGRMLIRGTDSLYCIE